MVQYGLVEEIYPRNNQRLSEATFNNRRYPQTVAVTVDQRGVLVAGGASNPRYIQSPAIESLLEQLIEQQKITNLHLAAMSGEEF